MKRFFLTCAFFFVINSSFVCYSHGGSSSNPKNSSSFSNIKEDTLSYEEELSDSDDGDGDLDIIEEEEEDGEIEGDDTVPTTLFGPNTPYEVKCHIFQYLGLPDLMNMGKTQKSANLNIFHNDTFGSIYIGNMLAASKAQLETEPYNPEAATSVLQKMLTLYKRIIKEGPAFEHYFNKNHTRRFIPTVLPIVEIPRLEAENPIDAAAPMVFVPVAPPVPAPIDPNPDKTQLQAQLSHLFHSFLHLKLLEKITSKEPAPKVLSELELAMPEPIIKSPEPAQENPFPAIHIPKDVMIFALEHADFLDPIFVRIGFLLLIKQDVLEPNVMSDDQAEILIALLEVHNADDVSLKELFVTLAQPNSYTLQSSHFSKIIKTYNQNQFQKNYPHLVQNNYRLALLKDYVSRKKIKRSFLDPALRNLIVEDHNLWLQTLAQYFHSKHVNPVTTAIMLRRTEALGEEARATALSEYLSRNRHSEKEQSVILEGILRLNSEVFIDALLKSYLEKYKITLEKQQTVLDKLTAPEYQCNLLHNLNNTPLGYLMTCIGKYLLANQLYGNAETRAPFLMHMLKNADCSLRQLRKIAMEADTWADEDQKTEAFKFILSRTTANEVLRRKIYQRAHAFTPENKLIIYDIYLRTKAASDDEAKLIAAYGKTLNKRDKRCIKKALNFAGRQSTAKTVY